MQTCVGSGQWRWCGCEKQYGHIGFLHVKCPPNLHLMEDGPGRRRQPPIFFRIHIMLTLHLQNETKLVFSLTQNAGHRHNPGYVLTVGICCDMRLAFCHLPIGMHTSRYLDLKFSNFVCLQAFRLSMLFEILTWRSRRLKGDF